MAVRWAATAAQRATTGARRGANWRSALCALCCALSACHSPLPEPLTRAVLHLHGDGYQRGLQHGQQQRHRIRAFYTRLLDVALFANLGREQPAIAGFLTHYQRPEYQDGNFSYQLLVEMAHSVATTLPQELLDELRGISDGCGLTYDQVLVLNTFADTVMAVRAIASTLRLSRGPRLQSVQFLGMKDGQGAPSKAISYVPLAHALTTSVPLDAGVRLVLNDSDGVDPATVRVVMAEVGKPPEVYVAGSPGYAAQPDGATGLAVTVTRPGGLPAAKAMSLLVFSGDLTVVSDPPPAHARFGREEGFAFTTAGDPRAASEVPNTAPNDGRSQPPPIAAAVRGSASADGMLRLAQHFALLDAGASSDATLVLVHHPKDGPAFATVSWAGIAFGFAGMSASGLSWTCNFSDTLDNAIVKDLLPKVSKLSTAQLSATGWPIGFALRHAAAQSATVDGAIAALSPLQHLMGWQCLLGDASGAMRGVEVDADARLIPSKTVDGLHVIGGEASAPGPTAAGDTADELRMSVHYVENLVDVDPAIATAATALLEPTGVPVRIDQQRVVSTYWLKSLRTFGQLGDAIRQGRGTWDLASLQRLVAEPRFVDTSDSMYAVVLEPKARRLYHATGALPATDAEWQLLDLSVEAP